jgi:PAS domain S-box-containing protein
MSEKEAAARRRTAKLRPPAGEADMFRLLVDSVQQYAIFMLDAGGHIASWNRGAARITGYDEAEVLGRHYSILYPDGDDGPVRAEQELDTAARAGRFEEEGWREAKGGRRFLAHVVLTAIRDGGALLGFAKVVRDLTEEHRAGTALRESEARFRELAESIREVFWISDPRFDSFEYVSPAYEQIWGRKPEGLYEDALSYMESVHPDDRHRVTRLMAELKRGAESDAEYRIIRPDGMIRWLRGRGFPVHDDAGALVRIVGVTEDITERREREEAQHFLTEASRVLASSLDYEETLRRVARLAVPRVADWCAIDMWEDGGIRRLAVAHADPAKAPLAQELGERYPPDPDSPVGIGKALRTGEAELVPEVTDELLRSLAVDEEHLRLLAQLGMRSGMLVPLKTRDRVLGSVVFIAAESGRCYGPDDLEFATALADRAALAIENALLFTETRRRAREEEALRRATQAVAASFTVEEVLERIAETAVDAMGADGAFVERPDIEADSAVVVAAAGRYAPARGSAVPLALSFLHRVIERGEAEIVPALGAHDRALPDDLPQRCTDCSAVAVPLVNGGTAVGALLLLRDPASGHFRADEIARARTFADLASLALRKVHLLADSEQRREELERVMVSRARLLRGFSHDVKNPLGAADGYLQLLEDKVVGELDERQLHSIAGARRALGSAVQLIDDLVELARTEAGHMELRLGPVDLREIARELAEDYRAQAAAKGLAITAELPAEFPLIVSDTARIRQILGNLLSNAVKYTARGHVRVTVGLRASGDEDECAVLQVADTGPGVPEEQRHRLFEEFTRLHPDSASGAGLGLAISRRIARALGGDITYGHGESGGSLFTLWLPLRRPAG